MAFHMMFLLLRTHYTFRSHDSGLNCYSFTLGMREQNMRHLQFKIAVMVMTRLDNVNMKYSCV